MGKSSKKKRRKERQRQERLHQLSTFGALNLSSRSSPSGSTNGSACVANENQVHNESRDRSDSDTDGTQHKEEIHITMTPSSRNASPTKSSSLKVDATTVFGSSSDRARTLPVVEFVYPIQTDGAHKSPTTPKPYIFGTSIEKSSIDVEDKSSTTVSTVVKSKQSLDEILYQKVKENNTKSTSDVLPVNELKNDAEDDGDTRKPSPSLESNSFDVETPQTATLQKPMEEAHPILYLSGVSVEEAVRDTAGLRPRANSTDGELKLPQRGLCDERKVLECYRWRSSSISGSHTTPKGFNNLGNTCFLNSTLQCLAYCPPLCQLLMNMRRTTGSTDDAPSTSPGQKVNQGKRFTQILAALFRRVHNTENTKGALSPRKIVSALPLLGSGSTRRNGYKFRPGRQEDAHEFLVHLLDAMNDGELREAGITANKSGWRDRLPVPRLDETTFVHRIFGGYLRSQVRCTDCGYRSNTYDPFLDLSLEISRNSCHSLSSAFNEFTRKETLDSQNRWKCSGCKKRVCATKQLTVFRPPLALCVQLKRFTFGGSFGGKISKAIEFPAQLQLPLSDGRSCGYVLTGIVIHVGGRASSGHYTACVQRPDANGERKWFHMDDSCVRPVSEQQVLRQQNAYVVMYCRQEVKIEFPTPTLKVSMTTDEARELAQLRQKAKSIKSNETTPTKDDADEKLEDENPSNVARSESRSFSYASGQIPSDSRALPLSSPNRASNINGPTSTKVKEAIEIKEPINERHVNGMKASMNVDTDALTPKKGESNERGNGAKATNVTTIDDPTNGIRVRSTNIGFHHCDPLSLTNLPESLIMGQGASSISAKKDELLALDSVVPKMTDNGRKPAENHKSIDQILPKESVAKSKSNISQISVDRGDSSKVEVIMRTHLNKQRAWIPKTAQTQKSDEFVLLGDIPVSKWDDDNDDNEGNAVANRPGTFDARTKIAKDIQSTEQDRKRKMFLDRHDALLDQGKVC